jgi:hypothetical protein
MVTSAELRVQMNSSCAAIWSKGAWLRSLISASEEELQGHQGITSSGMRLSVADHTMAPCQSWQRSKGHSVSQLLASRTGLFQQALKSTQRLRKFVLWVHQLHQIEEIRHPSKGHPCARGKSWTFQHGPKRQGINPFRSMAIEIHPASSQKVHGRICVKVCCQVVVQVEIPNPKALAIAASNRQPNLDQW